MNPYSVFQQGSFQTFLQILVPGVLGGAPWGALGYALFDETQALVCTNLTVPQTVGLILLAIVPAVFLGALFLEIGMWWEIQVLDEKRTKADPDFKKRWHAYLRTRLGNDQLVAHGYVAYLVGWMKFEQATTVALASFLAGLVANAVWGHLVFPSGWFWFLFASGLLGSLFFGCTANDTHKRLDGIREEILTAVNLNDPKPRNAGND